MIDIYELARILPETLFGLATYNHDTQTAQWEPKHPTCDAKQNQENPWSFKYGSSDWFDAEGREYSFNNSEYTVGFTWKILPFSPEALEDWRKRRIAWSKMA